MAVPEIVSSAEVLSYMAKESESSQPVLDRIAMIKKGAERAVRRYVGSNIVQATYTHILPRANLCLNRVDLGEILRLPEWPLRSVTSIYEDLNAYGGAGQDAFAAETLLVAGSNYYPAVNQTGLAMFGHIIRLGTCWPAIPGSIKAVYVAGWSAEELDGDVTDPGLDASDIKLATLKTIAEAYNRSAQQTSSGGTIESEKIDDYSVTYDTSQASSSLVEVPRDAKLMLAPFKRGLAG